uniref:Nuclear pore complex protein n=1 Tax=Mesocestoides corti TaxID=53468 RepID=A0A5K3EYE8_MESCO
MSLPSVQMTYWIWIRLDCCEMTQNFTVVHVEPIRQIPNLQDASTEAAFTLIDFIPCLTYDHDSNSSNFANVLFDEAAQPTLGIWSLVDASSEGASSHPTLKWSVCEVKGLQGAILPPLESSEFNYLHPWQEPLPNSIFINRINPDNCPGRDDLTDDVDKESIDISVFVDFIFTPGRFALQAIYNAFKLQPSLAVSEFKTLLRTLHQNLQDYHQQASEPLGLFCMQSSTDVVVVRRSGISVPRRLCSTEAILWTHTLSNDCAVESDLQTDAGSHQFARLRCRDCLLSHCRQVVRGLAQSQVWLEHERNICRNAANFSQTAVILNRLVIDLVAEDCHHPISCGVADADSEGMCEAFEWLLDLLSVPEDHPMLVSRSEEEGVAQDESSAGNVTNRGINFQGSSYSMDFGSRLTAELLRQGVWRATNTHLRFCVAAYLLWRHGNYFASTGSSRRVEEKLQQVYRSLAVIQWLTLTRGGPMPEKGYLSSVSTHLKLLGMPEWTPCSEFGVLGEPGQRGVSLSENFIQYPGVTLLEELILSASSNLPIRPCKEFWQAQSSNVITALQREFWPVLEGGQTMLPVLRHLLVNARCRDILALCKCLSPSAFADINLEGLLKTCPKSDEAEESELIPAIESWWPGDVNALYVCACLALLWSGLTDEAIEQHIEGSLYLRNRLLGRLHPLSNECLPGLIFNENAAAPCSILEQLFPTEFSLSGSLGLPPSIYGDKSFLYTPFVVDEVQIRYLIKIMPVLEHLDKSQHVIRLCEYALGVIRRAANNASTKGFLNFRVDPHLSSLLCGTGAKTVYPPFDVIAPQQTGRNSLFPVSAVCIEDTDFLDIANNLSELEAVLRTRVFKHELAMGNTARAHALVMSNPDKARQRDCLHLFITTLCDRGETAELVNFEYGHMED